MNKILATVLALAMVLTCASFPAFAADVETLKPTGVTSTFTAASSYQPVSGIIDGVFTTGNYTYFRGANIGTSGDGTSVLGSFVFEFDTPVNLTEIYFQMGGTNHILKGAVYGSNDNSTWTPIHQLGADADLTWTTASTGAGKTNTQAISHEGYYKYIKVDATKIGGTWLTWVEAVFTGTVQEVAGAPVKITPVGATSDFPNHSNYGSILAVIDGSEAGNSNFFRSSTYTTSTGTPGDSRNLSFVVDLGASYIIAKFYSSWGVNYAKGIALWGSADGVDFGTEPFATVSLTNTSGMVEIDCDTSYRYIKVDAYSILNNNNNPACKEVTFYGYDSASVQMVEYTVNYVDAEGNPVAEAKTASGFVGATVTETAPAITGYVLDEATKTITLVDGTNTITFTYTAKESAGYTVNYVDEKGESIAPAKTVTGKFVGDSVTENAIEITGYEADEASKSITLINGTNTITFTYTKSDVSQPVSLVPSSVTSTFEPLQATTPVSAIINGTAYASAYNYFATKNSLTLYSGEDTAQGSFVFDFEDAVNLTEIEFIMGQRNMQYGKLYASNSVSDPSATEGWTPIWSFEDLSYTIINPSDGSAGRTTTQTIEHDGYYRYFKVDVTGISQAGTLVWLESYFMGTTGTPTVDGTDFSADTIITLGAGIRLEENGLSAGIRFGAQIDKAKAGIEGTYTYSDDAEIKFGMFLLPEEMLGGKTLAQFVKNDTTGTALDIVAKNIKYQDDDIIEYTAVLIDIPAEQWDQLIVAVPYILVDGRYAFFNDYEHSYKGVAQDARATKYSDEKIAAEEDANIKAEMQAVADKLDEIVKPAVEEKTVDLVIFMGQSNMAGYGGTASLAPTVPEGHGYWFKSISDPTKLYNITEPFGAGETNMDSGLGNCQRNGSMVSAFANAYYEDTGVPIVAVFAAQGNTAISWWKPGDAPLNDAINRYKTAKNWLVNNGYTVRNSFMVWCQGESDGWNSTAKSSYKTQFLDIFSAMQNEGIDACFMVRIGEQKSSSTQFDQIILAQNELCKQNAGVVMVCTATAGFVSEGLMSDNVHYSQVGYNKAGTLAGQNAAYYVNTGKKPSMDDPKYANTYDPYK